MNYGYIVGQESKALAYYEARLQVVSSPDERRDLETVLQNIKRVVKTKPADVQPVEGGPSRFSLSFQGGIGR